MTEQELDQALRTKQPVIWRGRAEYETTVGMVTGIIRRHEQGQDVISVEITSFPGIKSKLICRPAEVNFWSPTEEKTKGEKA